MARAPKRAKPKSRHYRCARCRSPIPSDYRFCASCNYDAQAINELVERAMRMFPGSREIPRR